jgi:BlaI family penicillinase repressor
MPRPRNENPTPAELEVLKIIWERGGLTVRDVMDELNRTRRRAYTSVMSLLNVMTDKGLLHRKPKGRAFIYTARMGREHTCRTIVGDVLERVFEGSASSLVAQLLAQSTPSEEELEQIHSLIESYKDSKDSR